MKLPRIIIFALLALTAGIWLSCDGGKNPNAQKPDAPSLLAILDSSQTWVEMNWNDQSVDENGFRVQRKSGGADWVVDATLGRNVTTHTATELQPSTQYTFRVIAYNDAGESAPSNEKTVTTLSDELAARPTGVSAVATGATLVTVSWTDPGELDSFRIQRGPDHVEWTTIGAVPDGVETFADNGVEQATTYFYRVGSVNIAGVNWSSAIVEVTTPEIGVPNPPSDLSAEFQLGSGVTLTWQDNSSDEDGFRIRRNITGQVFEVLDSVAADITTYFDDLRESTGVYSYQVFAFNEFGNSDSSNIIVVDYNFRSDGIIPLFPSNYWRYNVEDLENSEDYQIERIVRDVGYVNGIDHYMIIEHRYPSDGGEIDTMFYLRNFEGIGCRGALYPLDEQSTSELLFQYPAQQPGSPGARYYFHGDSVIVILRNHVVTTPDTTFTGVNVYQRFFQNSDRSIKYYIVPNTVGIIKEEEFQSSMSTLVRTIDEWTVHN